LPPSAELKAPERTFTFTYWRIEGDFAAIGLALDYFPAQKRLIRGAGGDKKRRGDPA